MKNVILKPKNISGTINAVSSKSISHRAVIAASLSELSSTVSNITFSKDIIATCEVMKNFGASIDNNESSLIIKGLNSESVTNTVMDCSESGSTLRFLIPLALLYGEEITFIGKGRLVERPLSPYYEIFEEQGISYETNNGCLPLKVNGRLQPGKFLMRGDISSQFISGLMFVLPLLKGDSEISLSTPLESKGYVDLTLDVLKKYSINVENEAYKTFYVKGNQKYISTDYRVEGDYSQAAFWLAAGVLGSSIKCGDLNIDSLQGDRVIVDIIKEMGGILNCKGNEITAENSRLHGVSIDVSQCPDLVPILSVLGALSEGTTKIYNAARLRIKESDRLTAITTELKKVGADITEGEDFLIIKGKQQLKGGSVNSWNDHRIAMAMAVASIRCENPIIITDSHVVEKSYPHFYEDFKMLGGDVNEWSMG